LLYVETMLVDPKLILAGIQIGGVIKLGMFQFKLLLRNKESV
jgi:hypothetical protein